MRVYERAPSTTTRLGKDSSTMLSSFHSPFPDTRPTPIQQRSVQSPRKLAAILISGLAVGAACLIFLWGLSHKIRRFQSSANSADSTAESFCCLDFLKSLRVDRDRDPCEDFEQYVCPRKARGETPEFRWNSWNAREALVRSREHPEALSGKLLSALRSQCESSLNRGPLAFVKEMTPAILHGARLSRTVNADQLLLFMAYLSLRLGIKTHVHISVADLHYPTLQVDVPLGTLASSFSFLSHACLECIDGVLGVVRDQTGGSVRLSDYLAFEASFDDRPDGVVSSCSPNLFRESDAATAWDTLSEDVFKAPHLDVRMICADMPGRIFTVFKQLATRVSTPLPVASVMVHAVASIYQDLTVNGTANASHHSEFRCLFQDGLPNIWVHYYAELTVSAPKNQLARDIFVKVTDAVKATVASLLPPGEEKTLFSYVQGLSPFLPYSALPRRLTPPMPVGNFSALFLLIKHYEFRLEKERRRRHFPKWHLTGATVYASEPWVTFTPWSYAVLDVLNPRKHLMNAPVLGVPIAKAVWHYLLEKENKLILFLLKNESELLSHLVDRTASLTERKNILEVVLALRTVLNATRTDGWDKSWKVSADWQDVTEGQLFFLRLGDSLCDGGDMNVAKLTNAVLKHDAIFSAAFKCPDRGFNRSGRVV
ncbi:hypothetical protein HPB49_025081 [Dermacentor silvarum]|uniref:Uncharacterized protein n=1 Tax=Dermacentor silvarum TaxID=543639 RepID=A0ACB8CC76_DERSI|nr:hypothetical protein HPB49_025081 [Dermacentor silvarum]